MTVTITEKNGGIAGVMKAIDELAKMELLVGVPSDDEPHLGSDAGPNVRNTGPASNALLAYVHNYGSPARNIPARPFMEPGIEKGIPQAEPYFQAAAVAAAEGDSGLAERNLMAAGLILQSAVRQEITEGDFTPLAASTIAARRRAGFAGEIRPLIATGQLRRSISFVLRKGNE